ncbi:hypothetical protein Sjap_025061 [Stephania japonica]|uniref:Zinc finger CCCH domain-containing protein 18-like n=1 Tax=Stephania japonica TaxID=461633 RepID=A0AAP0E3P1_9MAGN
MSMDFSESTKVVFNRIQELEPENVSKIIGYFLLQDHSERDMIRLAFGPDNLILSLIERAKAELGLLAKPIIPTSVTPAGMKPAPISDVPMQFTPFTPSSTGSFPSPARPFHMGGPYWDSRALTDQQLIHNMDFIPPVYSESISDDYRLQNQAQYFNFEDQLEPGNAMGPEFLSNIYQDPGMGTFPPRTSRRSPSMPEFPLKACHYFNKGFCKHGNNCRYFHGQLQPDGFPPFFNQHSNDMVREDYGFSEGSLEKLKMELTELLRSQRGYPISIASLPLLYQEKYGKTLQAEGYLTESQRHGKAGYSLTKLLARLKNSIRVIDRPHGQHAVILAEDAPNMEYWTERGEPGGIASGSRQIYLTFPAESTFTEEDVSNYFKSFGPVQDVRIPCQQKRMFGFVTFVHPETVKMILSKGNPHFVCGARVLVKPYKEKSRLLIDRKHAENAEPLGFYHSHLDMEPDFHSIDRGFDNLRFMGKQFIEEQEQDTKIERMRLSELQLAAKQMAQRPYFGYSVDELKISEGQNELPSMDRFSYLMDVLNSASTNDEQTRNSNTNYGDQESSQGINLPESPFASPVASSISTVI